MWEVGVGRAGKSKGEKRGTTVIVQQKKMKIKKVNRQKRGKCRKRGWRTRRKKGREHHRIYYDFMCYNLLINTIGKILLFSAW